MYIVLHYCMVIGLLKYILTLVFQRLLSVLIKALLNWSVIALITVAAIISNSIEGKEYLINLFTFSIEIFSLLLLIFIQLIRLLRYIYIHYKTELIIVASYIVIFIKRIFVYFIQKIHVSFKFTCNISYKVIRFIVDNIRQITRAALIDFAYRLIAEIFKNLELAFPIFIVYFIFVIIFTPIIKDVWYSSSV